MMRYCFYCRCYDCDDEVLVEGSSRNKLQECMDFLRKQMGLASGRTDAPQLGVGRRTSASRTEGADGATDTAGKDDKANLQNKTKVGLPSVVCSLPKVKGISNLGNTCFFNAVMQVSYPTIHLHSANLTFKLIDVSTSVLNFCILFAKYYMQIKRLLDDNNIDFYNSCMNSPSSG